MSESAYLVYQIPKHILSGIEAGLSKDKKKPTNVSQSSELSSSKSSRNPDRLDEKPVFRRDDDDIYGGIINDTIEKYVPIGALDQKVSAEKVITKKISSTTVIAPVSFCSGDLSRQMLDDVISDDEDHRYENNFKTTLRNADTASSFDEPHSSKLNKILETAVDPATLSRHSIGGSTGNIFTGYSNSVAGYGQAMGRGTYDEYSNIGYFEVT